MSIINKTISISNLSTGSVDSVLITIYQNSYPLYNTTIYNPGATFSFTTPDIGESGLFKITFEINYTFDGKLCTGYVEMFHTEKSIKIVYADLAWLSQGIVFRTNDNDIHVIRYRINGGSWTNGLFYNDSILYPSVLPGSSNQVYDAELNNGKIISLNFIRESAIYLQPQNTNASLSLYDNDTLQLNYSTNPGYASDCNTIPVDSLMTISINASVEVNNELITLQPNYNCSVSGSSRIENADLFLNLSSYLDTDNILSVTNNTHFSNSSIYFSVKYI